MAVLFNKQLGSSLLKESFKEVPIAITTADKVTYVATQTGIYKTATGKKLNKIFDSIVKIRDLYCIPHINIIIIVYDDLVEFRNIDNIQSKEKPHYQSINIRSTNVSIWNNISSNHVVSRDTNSDMISLATVVLDQHQRILSEPATPNDTDNPSTITIHDPPEPTQTPLPKSSTGELSDLISCVALASKNHVVVLKWLNHNFIDQYNLYMSNTQFTQFIAADQLLCISSSNPNDLIHVNLTTSKIKHNDLFNLLNIKSSMMSFKHNNQLANTHFFSNRIVFLKYDLFIAVTFPNFEKLAYVKITNTNFKASRIEFPFIILMYGNSIEVRSIADFKLFQTIFLDSIIKLDYHDTNISILTKERITILEMIDYNQILELLYNDKDYDNAILLVENLDISNFTAYSTTQNVAQLKFEKLRKFQLLKALNLLQVSDDQFSKAIDLFSEYLASPKLVISNLSQGLKQVIENGELPPSYTQKSQIYQLISFLTDSRRKLIRLLDNKFTVFKYNNLEITLAVYKDDDPNFSVEKNLTLLDNYLFECYLLVNTRMINPFLRSKTFCDFEKVEVKCKDLKLLDQLITFYYARGEFSKSVELLRQLNKIDELVIFLQKLIRLPHVPMGLITDNLQVIIDKNSNNFDLLLLNNNIDYSNVDYRQIVEYLTRHSLKDYRVRYLEYLILNQKVTSLELSNELFDIYFADIEANHEKIAKLYSVSSYNANQILKKLKNLPPSEISQKLMIPPLIKLGRYDDILNIYVYDLNDIKASIDFCLHVRDIKNDSLSRGLIFKVIDLCLKKKEYSSIIDFILNNTALDYIDFEEILIKLPNEMSIDLMSSFLVLNLKRMNTFNKSLIVKNELLKVNVINMKLEKLSLERKMFKMTQNSICVHCGRNFNKSEILCFHPNGDVLHYKCSKAL
ncbi:hypothetical protein PMKS-000329 [Pichia membranifaciens]|uniref:CNH domain-containing protein n=1 Tax=Pichia membranifaciens TaxID=4926 RepID=A0A1Q2YBJ9_9ASCO|nr:hypothetical protein PMKS-000329 [Pichia membranifaciens]